MKERAPPFLGTIAVLAFIAACGGGGPSRERDGGMAIAGIDGRVSIIRPGQDANAAYSQGLDLKTQGDCAAAALKLRPVAGLGPGYENAQTALGTCLLQIGMTDKELSSDYLEGLTWLRRAADAGWPEAQGALAVAHAFGPATIRNGNETGYWLSLYEANTGKSRIGFVAMAAADIESVGKTLTTSDREAGAARAALWQRKVWLPPVQQPTGLDSGRGLRRGGQRDPN